ncbi:MAG: hypothetical protein XD98_0432 [Microgenomates bacterium 39_6]|nr:MAG: hypothetical protein XD98_0432 [Microgenomates bacterium 39_6]
MERLFSKENRISSFTWFFPAPTRNERGILPAPHEAVEKKEELKEGWLKEKGHPQEFRCVSLAPTTANGQAGYQVRAETFIQATREN